MTTRCICGHAKSQHHDGRCDYVGYSCRCKGYKRVSPPVANAVVVRLADYRGDIDHTVEVTQEEWATLVRGAVVCPQGLEHEVTQLDASVMDDVAQKLFDMLLIRDEVDRSNATHVIWVP